MPKSVSRSTVNEQQYSAPAFSKSGFNLTHRKYSSFLIGRTHVSGSQWIMPGDKISGKNEGNFTMNRIVTPMVSPIEVSQYNIFLPFRAIDKTFERAMAPSKNNSMSQTWNVPLVNTADLVKDILDTYAGSTTPNNVHNFIVTLMKTLDSSGDSATMSDWETDHSVTISSYIYQSASNVLPLIKTSLTTGAFATMADKMYLKDALLDIWDKFEKTFGPADGSNPAITSSDLVSTVLYNYIDCLFTPFIGRYSYYAEFGFQYLRPKDIYDLSHEPLNSSDTIQDFINMFSTVHQCEYPLRVMYAIWYERFRNVDIEPVNSNLPDWREFGSTSIFDLANGGNLCYLLYRIRNWYQDMFTSAQVDDLSRHVYAPIYGDLNSDAVSVVAESGDSVNVLTSDTSILAPGRVNFHMYQPNNQDTQTLGFDGVSSPKPSSIELQWRDQLSGSNKHITCPIPTNINDILSSTDLTPIDVFGLDLNTLRQTQQLERYLKRNYLFGDEYQDRMMAHYNARVSDMRINRPEVISTSLNDAKYAEQIANMSNGISEAGDRTATGTLKASGDQYTMFAEEFGLLVHLINFMPLASYDGTTPQLLMSKQIDFPLPEFATNNEEFGRKLEIADSALDRAYSGYDNHYMFGRYPAYHAWRERVDSVGGMYLHELQNCTFRRFWGLDSVDGIPKLNYQFIHCRPNLGMFANTILYDSQIYGDIVHECYVERVLPTPVELI